ncbi:MAG: NUDIX domain-containing protein [Candidatus Kerfeldbacteria bacterium]|nr:NUDIX domain-containing protein [Candidatus Kerfeldbacteria bacterium]
MNGVNKLFVATKAFIIFDSKVLILKESSKYQDGTNVDKFDVCGGRLQPGERFDEGLRREVKEETGLEVSVGKPFFVNEWRPVVQGEQWQIVGVFFECRANSNEVRLSSDHDAYQWIEPSQHPKYNLIENLRPAFEVFNQLRNK